PLSYSSRARATQRSMVAALLISTSSINGSCTANIVQQARTRLVQCSLVTENEALIQGGIAISGPDPSARGDDAILHHGRCRSQVEQINRTARQVCQLTRQLP